MFFLMRTKIHCICFILHLQVVAKQSESCFLAEKAEKANELDKKIREKEAHRDELSQKNQKNSKELEAVTKIKAAHQRRNDDIQKKIRKDQESIKEMQITNCCDSENIEERVQRAETDHQEMSLKLQIRHEDLQKMKSFDSSLHDEVMRKHEDKRKPLEKRLFALKDELAVINAKLNAYGSKGTKARAAYGSNTTTPSTRASLPNPSGETRFSPAVSAQFSPGNPEGVNKFFKNKRTPTYGQKSVSFRQDTKHSASGGKKRTSATSANGNPRPAKEPKTPRSASRNKKLFTASGYSVFDESP